MTWISIAITTVMVLSAVMLVVHLRPKRMLTLGVDWLLLIGATLLLLVPPWCLVLLPPLQSIAKALLVAALVLANVLLLWLAFRLHKSQSQHFTPGFFLVYALVIVLLSGAIAAMGSLRLAFDDAPLTAEAQGIQPPSKDDSSGDIGSFPRQMLAASAQFGWPWTLFGIMLALLKIRGILPTACNYDAVLSLVTQTLRATRREAVTALRHPRVRMAVYTPSLGNVSADNVESYIEYRRELLAMAREDSGVKLIVLCLDWHDIRRLYGWYAILLLNRSARNTTILENRIPEIVNELYLKVACLEALDLCVRLEACDKLAISGAQTEGFGAMRTLGINALPNAHIVSTEARTLMWIPYGISHRLADTDPIHLPDSLSAPPYGKVDLLIPEARSRIFAALKEVLAGVKTEVGRVMASDRCADRPDGARRYECARDGSRHDVADDFETLMDEIAAQLGVAEAETDNMEQPGQFLLGLLAKLKSEKGVSIDGAKCVAFQTDNPSVMDEVDRKWLSRDESELPVWRSPWGQ